MALEIGSRLGHYDVTALIGEGGMGQVYQATDIKLNRQVALKILPEAFAGDPDRLARFQREAQVLASLNHPGIAAIYGLEEADDTRALVLELVEGPTLADRIAHGPIPLDEALPIAKQIAEALEAAHEAGVIHRDLKPANIKVRDDGTVKVLDFGLAKALDTTPEGDPSLSPTLTAAATQMGVIMGTAAYMSPEQARGKPVDKRADIWAFGAVLFEMLSGQKPFPGDDVSQTLARVIDREPDWSVLPVEVPERVRQALRVCLRKDVKQRIGDICDVCLAMEGAFETTVGQSPATPPRPAVWLRAVPLALGLAAVSAVLASLAVWSLSRSDAPRLARFALGVAPSPSLNTGGTPSVVVSPDGGRIVYVSPAGGISSTGQVSSNGQLWVRQIDQLEAVPLRGGVGLNPFFSPDGRDIAFRGFRSDSNLYRVSVQGGPPVRVTEGLNQIIAGGTWGPDDTIVLASQGGPLFKVSAAGGDREPLTELREDETDHRWPEFLPGGEAILFTVVKGEGFENMETWVLDLNNNQRQMLISGGSSPRYSPSGHVIYGADGTLRAVAFDLDELAITGDPSPVLEGVVTHRSGAAQFSIGQDGSLAYVTGGSGVGIQRRLAWVDRDGVETPVVSDPRAYDGLELSPDNSQAATVVLDGDGVGDVWIEDLERGIPAQLTFDPANDFTPVWSPDGVRVFWSSLRGSFGGNNAFSKAADGTGDVDQVTSGEGNRGPISVSPDGRTLLFWQGSFDGGFDLGARSMDDGTTEILLADDFSYSHVQLSPDGRMMAYISTEEGQEEIYIRPFPNLNDDRVKVSPDGGFSPRWGPDSRELFYQKYQDGDRESGMVTLMVASIETEPRLRAETPVSMFTGPYLAGELALVRGHTYDVSADGQQFLMIKEAVGGADPRDIILIQNFDEELKRLVPVN